MLACALAGCAVTTIDRPATDRRRSDPPRCSASRGAATVDGLLAGGWGVVSLLAVSNEAGEAAAVTALIGGLHALSAMAGVRAARMCEHAHADYQAWLDEERARIAALEADTPPLAAQGAPPGAPAGTPGAPVADADAPADTSHPAIPAPSTARPAETGETAPPAPVPANAADRSTGGEQEDPWRDFWKEVTP